MDYQQFVIWLEKQTAALDEQARQNEAMRVSLQADLSKPLVPPTMPGTVAALPVAQAATVQSRSAVPVSLPIETAALDELADTESSYMELVGDDKGDAWPEPEPEPVAMPPVPPAPPQRVIRPANLRAAYGGAA